jgi:anti-sigma28 factor (negative regulator of flagellin synthesis)
MDITLNDDTYPEKGPVQQTAAVVCHMHAEQHISDNTGAAETPDLSWCIAAALASPLVSAPEAREAKIRELQASIESGTYDVPAEQIADKVLRCTLGII